MAATIRLPPFIAKLYYMFLAVNPTYRRHYGLVIEHVDALVPHLDPLVFGLISLRSCKSEAHKVVQEALAIGEEPAPATSLVGMVVQKEHSGSQDKLSDAELRDEAISFLL